MIPKSDLLIRGIYRMHARNITVAVWDGKGFIGIREKFNQHFLDSEVPYEDGPPFGTARATELLDFLPENIGIHQREPTVCDNCGKPARWSGPPAPAPWVCEGGCERVDPVTYQNNELFKFLEGIQGN